MINEQKSLYKVETKVSSRFTAKEMSEMHSEYTCMVALSTFLHHMDT